MQFLLRFNNAQKLMLTLLIMRSAFKRIRDRGIEDGWLCPDAEAMLATEALQITAVLERIRRAAEKGEENFRLSRAVLKAIQKYGVTYVPIDSKRKKPGGALAAMRGPKPSRKSSARRA